MLGFLLQHARGVRVGFENKVLPVDKFLVVGGNCRNFLQKYQVLSV